MRPERARLELGTQVIQEPGNADGLPDRHGRQAVEARGVRSGVARDPDIRHGQRRRLVHEVEEVIEPEAGIGRRPAVKLYFRADVPVMRRLVPPIPCQPDDGSETR
jgi:hypothetical protein